jgi:hypothetical protein
MKGKKKKGKEKKLNKRKGSIGRKGDEKEKGRKDFCLFFLISQHFHPFQTLSDSNSKKRLSLTDQVLNKIRRNPSTDFNIGSSDSSDETDHARISNKIKEVLCRVNFNIIIISSSVIVDSVCSSKNFQHNSIILSWARS